VKKDQNNYIQTIDLFLLAMAWQ